MDEILDELGGNVHNAGGDAMLPAGCLALGGGGG
jgi:hypothetical protein